MATNTQKSRAVRWGVVFWILALCLFLTGIALVVVAKDLGDIKLALLGSLAWGGSVFFLLVGFLHLRPVGESVTELKTSYGLEEGGTREAANAAKYRAV